MNGWLDLACWIDGLQSALDGRSRVAELEYSLGELEELHGRRVTSLVEQLAATGCLPDLNEAECILLSLRLHWACTACRLLADAESLGVVETTNRHADRADRLRFLMRHAWRAIGEPHALALESEFAFKSGPRSFCR